MKIIERKNYPSIIKKEISLKDLINYKDLNMKLITKLLNKVISQNIYSTIDLLKLIKDNYNKSLINTINHIKDYSNVRFNCYYATKLLKEELKKIGIYTKIISYKSIGFSTSYGDNLIKEAHMALLLPTKKRKKIYYILLDPGLRIPKPICFFKDKKKTIMKIDHDKIIIERSNNDNYPYSMEMSGYNRYSTNNTNYKCKEFFDVRYETINPIDILFPISYNILDGYRIINFPSNIENQATIKIMIIDKYLECINSDTKTRLYFREIENISRRKLIKILNPFTDKLNIDTEELIDTILFMLKHNQEFIDTVINRIVIKEKDIL